MEGPDYESLLNADTPDDPETVVRYLALRPEDFRVLEALSGSISEEFLNGGRELAKQVLDEVAVALAREWRLTVSDRSRERERTFVEHQALLEWAYHGRSPNPSSEEYSHAQRYLGFLYARFLLESPCPLDALRAEHCVLLKRVTVQQAIEFEAYLNYIGRGRLHADPGTARVDYEEAAGRWERASCDCPYHDRGDCVRRLAELHAEASECAAPEDRTLFPVAGSQESRVGLIDSRVAHGATRQEATKFIHMFYDWMEVAGENLSANLAEGLLTTIYARPRTVCLFEFMAKCCIVRQQPAVHERVRASLGLARLPTPARPPR